MPDEHCENGLFRLTEKAYTCSRCEGLGFGRSPSGGFWKFPPTIGARKDIQLLFVGLNPRKDEANAGLYANAMASLEAFQTFSRNRIGRAPYIAAETPEGRAHYSLHLRVAEGVCPGQAFNDVAAVTEYYLCGGDRSVTRSLPRLSRCAPHFLVPLIELVQPSVVLTLGEVVTDHFRRMAKVSKSELAFEVKIGSYQGWVVQLPHYGARTSRAQRAFLEQLEAWAPGAARAIIAGSSPPPGPERP